MLETKRHIKVTVLMDMPLFPYRIYCYNELAKRGYDLHVVSVSQKEQAYDIPLLFHHHVLTPQKIGPFVKLKGFHKNDYGDCDLFIIALNTRFIDYLPLFVGKDRKRVIAWGHMKGQTRGNRLSQYIRMKIARRLPALVFYDYETRDEYLAKGFPKESLFVANNTQYVDPATIDLKKERSYFLYVGRIQERKGLDLALRSFAKVLTSLPETNVRFKIVGGGNIDLLVTLIKELKISDSVDFEGPVHDEKLLGTLFSRALAYVSPGHVGLGVLHSFAFGVPVLTCIDRKHSVEFSNCSDQNSYLVHYTVENVEDAMKSIVTDKELLKRKSQAAYNHYTEYCTIDKMVDGIDDAIKSLGI